MKRILTLAICFGLASTMVVSAKNKEDKRVKKARHAQEKFEKQQRKFVREEGRGDRGRGERRVDIEREITPRVDAQVRFSGNRTRARIERRGPANFSWSINEARRYHNRGSRHDRNWYRSRYDRFARFAGGYYYFDRGYWYPAYGYDPVYTTYQFDEPIYGYNSLDPHQVIVNVQVELRREGYYRGSIDGLIGPMTRSALARYQRDRGLFVSRAIDGPTLAALGLT